MYKSDVPIKFRKWSLILAVLIDMLLMSQAVSTDDYVYHANKLNKDDAAVQCSLKGMTLATPRTQAEIDGLAEINTLVRNDSTFGIFVSRM